MTPPPTLSPAEQLLLRLSYSLRAAWTAPEAGAYLHDHTPAGRIEAVLVLTAAGVLLPSPADPARLELDPHRRLVAAEAGRCLAVLRGCYQGGELVPLEQAWALWGHAPPLRHQQEALAVLVRAGYLALEPGAVVLLTAGLGAEVRVCNLKLWCLPASSTSTSAGVGSRWWGIPDALLGDDDQVCEAPGDAEADVTIDLDLRGGEIR